MRRADLVEKYGLDYELRYQKWLEEMKADPTVFQMKALLVELMKRGIIERVVSPLPYSNVVWRLK